MNIKNVIKNRTNLLNSTIERYQEQIALNNHFITQRKRDIALLSNLHNLELNRLYKMQITRQISTAYSEEQELWGFIRAFNKDAAIITVVATNNDIHVIQDSLNESNSERSKMKNRVASIHLIYSLLVDPKVCTNAKKDDLPLLIGLPYRYPALESLLKGTCEILMN